MVHVSVQHLTTVIIILLDATRQHSDGLVLDGHHPSIRIVAKAETQERWPKLANKGLVRYADDQMASHEHLHEKRFSRSLDENEPEQSGSLPHKHEKDQSTGTSEDVSHSEHDNKTKDISPTSPGIATRATSGLSNLLGYLKPRSWSKQPTMPTVEKETSLHVRESDGNKQSQLENEHEAAKSGAIDHKSADEHSSSDSIESDNHSGHEAAKSGVIKRESAKDQFSSGIKTVSHHGNEAAKSSTFDPKSAEDHRKGTGSHNINHHHSSQHASTKTKISLADRVKGIWSSKFPAVKKTYTKAKGGLSKVFKKLHGLLKKRKEKLSDWIRSWKAQKGSKDTENNVSPSPDASHAFSSNSKAKASSKPNSPRKSESTARSLIGKDHKYNAISS